MRITDPEISFQNDSRGVSEVVGFLLIFAILVILLSINQAQFVPQENREVEFQHLQDVQNDMVDVRSAISTAGQTNVSQYPTVRLGTNYPTRLFAVNPPPPTGTLRTSRSYNISIYDDPAMTSDPQNVSTQFLEYQNGYNELNVGSIWYENSVLYLDETSNDGNIAVIENQNLLTGDRDPVRITALQKNYTKSSTGRVAIEFYPANNPEVDLDELDGMVTITIPTRLNKEYWDSELSDYSAYNQDQFETNPESINFLQLTVNINLLKFNTVGINSAPDDEASAKEGINGGPPGNGPPGNGPPGNGPPGNGPPGNGATLPDGAVAFNDQDGDGVYDNSEPTYTESEAAQLDESVDLVIEKDISVDKIDIGTQSVRLKNGARLDTNNELKLDVSGDVNIEAGTLLSDNKITLKSGNSGVNAQDATLESKNEMKITADGGDLDLTSANVDSDNKITLTALDKISAQGATLESKNEMKITADGGDVNIRSGRLTSNNKITLTSSADIDARDTQLQAKNQIKASPASSGTLFVNNNGGNRMDGGTYIEDQNGDGTSISLQQGSVSGTPEKGSVD